jgi:hypothetical protein
MTTPLEHRHVDPASGDFYGETSPLVRPPPDTLESRDDGIATGRDALAALAQRAERSPR